MVKAISFCLFGEKVGYINGFVENVKVVDRYYPGWVVLCYISEDTFNRFKDILEPVLEKVWLVIVSKSIETDIGGMFWRFLAAEIADIFVCRDADSLLSHKECMAVNEWIESDKDFHIMRDHQYHGEKIMGGMWGHKGSSLKNIRELIFSYNNNGYAYNADQMFLATLFTQ